MTTRTLPKIPLKTYRLYFETTECVRLPDYPGSAWRGAFGHALKRTVCVVRNTPCKQCLLKHACAYSYIFETPPSPNAEKMRKYSAIPHPFVFRFPKQVSATGIYSFDLTLFGHGQRYFPYIVHALQTAGKDGIGGHRQIFDLIKIDELDFQGNAQTIYHDGELQAQQNAASPLVPDMPSQIALRFESPIRIKQQQKNLIADDFNFGALFSNLLRRISMISYFHTDTPLETDFAGLTAQARSLSFIERELVWYDWTRYSSRQQTEMSMGGLVGSATVDMQGMEDFWPYLWLGQWIHVGKGTSMGMGAYSLASTSLPSD